jgi:hypothetical protein
LVEDLEDPRRTEPAYLADERTMVEAWLEFHRMTLLLKCEGVDRAGLVARPVATSLLSLPLEAHLTYWFYLGATGFGPVTRSVSAKHREPLCYTLFSQVIANRRCRRETLS